MKTDDKYEKKIDHIEKGKVQASTMFDSDYYNELAYLHKYYTETRAFRQFAVENQRGYNAQYRQRCDEYRIQWCAVDALIGKHTSWCTWYLSQ